jgi:hypothetical protein
MRTQAIALSVDSCIVSLLRCDRDRFFYSLQGRPARPTAAIFGPANISCTDHLLSQLLALERQPSKERWRLEAFSEQLGELK